MGNPKKDLGLEQWMRAVVDEKAADRRDSFGIRLQSTGSEQNVALTRIVMQTFFVTPKKSCLVTFDQIILTPFTGLGQFDLVEYNSSDAPVFDDEGNIVSGGESEVILATKSGFTDGATISGHSRLVKANTVDKIYMVIFVPGSAGDGIYSINVRELNIPTLPETGA